MLMDRPNYVVRPAAKLRDLWIVPADYKKIFSSRCPKKSIFRLCLIRGGFLTVKKLNGRRRPSFPLDDDFSELIGPAEVAKWLGVSVAWVRDHSTRKAPLIPFVKVGRLLRYRPGDVRGFLRYQHSDVEAVGLNHEQG
jgi:hypothetical protein